MLMTDGSEGMSRPMSQGQSSASAASFLLLLNFSDILSLKECKVKRGVTAERKKGRLGHCHWYVQCVCVSQRLQNSVTP